MPRRSTATVVPTSPAGADEASELERQAAELRADAAALEAELLERRLEEEAKVFDAVFDAEGSGTVDVHKLRRGLEEYTKKPVAEDMALRVLQQHDADGDGVLRREHFRLSSLLDTLDRLIAEEREQELQARREEREKAEAEAALPPANEDTSLPVRALSALVYILPLIDTARYGQALALMVPALNALVVPLLALDDVPFLGIILFFSMDFLSRDVKLPQLLRFSMRQAVALDIFVAFVGLLQFVGVPLGYVYEQLEKAPLDQAEAGILFKSFVFLGCLACILYSAGCNFLGVAPDGIPFISGYAEKGLPAVRTQKPKEKDGEQQN